MNKGVTSEWIAALKDKLNIVDVIGEHVVLRKAGSQHVGLCPFHSERSPSFNVSELKQLYHCHGCHAGGDIIRFMMEIQGLSFMEALQELALRADVSFPKEALRQTQQEMKNASEAKTAYRLNRFAAGFYRQSLEKNQEAKEYLKSRGITEDLMREFYIGYADDSWESLVHHLKKSKAPLDIAEKLGLIRVSQKKQGDYFDLFRERVLFPILDLKGHVAGFGGRILSKKDDGPKYLNSQDSFLFQKSKLAFGLYQAKKYIRENDEVILVEGYFDVLALNSTGIKNAVACCGTALTADHIKLLSRFAGRITVFFDGDRAGQDAMLRAMELGLEQGKVLYGVLSPEGQDPDEFVKSASLEAVQERMKTSFPLLDYFIDCEVDHASHSMDAKSESLKKIAHWLKNFRDPVGVQMRIEAVASKLGVSIGLIEKAMGRQVTPRPAPQPMPPRQIRAQRGVTEDGFDKSIVHDQVLLMSLAQGAHLDLWVQILGRLPEGSNLSDLFMHPVTKKFTEKTLKNQGQIALSIENWPSLLESMLKQSEIEDSQVLSIISQAIVGIEDEVSEEVLKNALYRAASKIWVRFSHRIRVEINTAESKDDSARQAELMQEYLDVQRKMKELNNFYGQV